MKRIKITLIMLISLFLTMTVNAQNTVRDLQIGGSNFRLSPNTPYHITHDANSGQYTLYRNNEAINSFSEILPIKTITTNVTGKIEGIIFKNTTQRLDSAYVILVSTGEISKPTDKEGLYQFDELIVGKEYRLHIIRKGYQSITDKLVMASASPDRSKGSFIMEPSSGDIHLSKVLIAMGDLNENGINAVFEVQMTDNQNLPWKIKSKPSWIDLDILEGVGRTTVLLSIKKDELSRIPYDERVDRIIVSTDDDRSSDELWVTVSGTGKGINLDYVITYTPKSSDIKESTANITGQVFESAPEYDEQGIRYYEKAKPENLFSPEKYEKKEFGDFTVTLKDLEAGITYRAYAYILNKKTGNIIRGNEIEFTTDVSFLPSKLTLSAINILSITSAMVTGNISFEGHPAYTKRGVCYATTPQPTIDNGTIKEDTTGLGTGNFNVELTGLSEGVIYYVRAYVINDNKPIYSDYGEAKILNMKLELPAVTTIGVSKETFTSITMRGNITSKGHPDYSERGFCYSQSNNKPTIGDLKDSQRGTGTGDYDIELTHMEKGVFYYVRSYVTNSKGSAYGEMVKVSIKDPSSYIDIGNSLGVQNTKTKIANTHGPAVTFCANSEVGGYDDWILPDNAQLTLMYQKKSLIGIVSGTYWSSTAKTHYVPPPRLPSLPPGGIYGYWITDGYYYMDFSNGSLDKYDDVNATITRYYRCVRKLP